ncbi:alpha/beta hydrolase [Streptomyces sp. NPDC049949]|uniref:alpha/beta hydrolase n=1 Tax=Streptomyces sp. NPDC049949 TaxID=3154627 RepID=UPI00344207AF
MSIGPDQGAADDAGRSRRMVRQIDGPVLLVGHSYGGAVIPEAGGLPNVTGLVYVAAFAPDAGESPGGISREQPPAALENTTPDSELRAGPVYRGGAGHGGGPEGPAGVDVRRRRHRTGMAGAADVVPGVRAGPG